MPTLSEKQLSAIALLVAGKNQTDTARDIGANRKTISRWLEQEEFVAELERRRSRLQQRHQAIADAAQDAEVQQFYQDLQAYREARLSTYRAKLARGTKILKRAGDRFDDLPDEAIAPQQLTGLFAIADQLCEAGLSGWAEILALDELLARLNGSDS